jgi:pimeloyl-ACP methyl ester carboxylesterase
MTAMWRWLAFACDAARVRPSAAPDIAKAPSTALCAVPLPRYAGEDEDSLAALQPGKGEGSSAALHPPPRSAAQRGRGTARSAVEGALARWIPRIAFLLLLVAALPAHAGSLAGTGVVFLHGKGVWAGAFDGGIPAALEAEGALIAEPEMPWSFTRLYGATYDEAMAEIDAAVAQLKARGATRIVVIGHSLGANAAIGYAARRSAVAAVVALAPGHLPETAEMRARTKDAVAEARGMLAAGTGLTSRHAWPDMIQGIPTFAFATPAVYVSMFDPTGPAVIPKNTTAMRPIPFLWVAGTSDPIFARGPDYAFARGARNPKSRYLEVSASHLTTPWVAQSQVVEWLKSL